MSDNVPLAIKYRPKKLSEIIGQKATVRAISNAFKAEDLHHAYIFGGHRGCGKTTSARVLAATENCFNSKTEPCGNCNNCIEIFAGKSLDVKEIDAASNRGIDDIRDLKKEAQFNPVNCRTKYFLLDESHSLTGHAAEAALKVIEEPPKHVRFVLCTTKPESLIDTIRSRCLLFKFNKVSWTEIYTHLVQIANRENLEFEEDALKLAAKAARGSVRDALQNLQSVIAYAGNSEKLTYEAARDILGVSDERLYFLLIESIAKFDVPKGMQIINKLLIDGREAKQITEGIEWHLRNLMIMLTCSKDLEPFGFLEDEVKRYKHQAASLTEKGTKVQLVLDWLSSLHDVNKGLIVNLDPQVLLETFVVKAIISKKRLEN